MLTSLAPQGKDCVMKIKVVKVEKIKTTTEGNN
jgi:hypothetical protein